MKNRIFKRIASLAVAICIVATLIPAAFADTTESGNGTLVYSFMRADYEGTEGYNSTYATCIKYANGNGNLEYYMSDITYDKNNSSSRNGDWNQKFDGSNFSPRFQLEAWGDTNKDYASYKIKGIGLYEYELVFDYALHSSGAEAAQVYILDPETTAEILAGTKTIVDAIDSNEISPVLDAVNMNVSSAENDIATATFTPEASGEHLLVFTRADYGTTKNVFPHKLTLTPIKGKTSSFSFASPTVVTTTDKSDEHYFSETRASSSAASKPGYLNFGDDMYVTASTSVQQLRLPNVNIYTPEDAATSLGSFGRYSLAFDNWGHFYTYGRLFLKHKLESDGIYNIKVSSGANSQGGLIGVYANGVHIGNIEDYKATFTANSEAIAVGKAELHTTDLKALKLTRDDNGYVEISFRALAGEGTDRTNGTADRVDFIPYSIDFELAEASETAEPEAVSNTTVAAFVMNEIGGTVSETPINSGAAGRSVTYTATPDEGYAFACWTDKDGKVLSEESAYTFNAYTNMSIYANFDEKDAVGVKFYNGNGEFLGFVEKESGKTFAEYKNDAPVATYGGASFEGWSIADETEISGIAYAVAQFTDVSEETVTATIKVNGSPIKNGNVPVGEPIVCTEEYATAWYRDGKYVFYGPSYTHYAFKNTVLSSGRNTIENKAPVAILDDLGDGLYMFEYDGGDHTVLAAGVIFGNSEAVKVSSCYANAKARNIENNHGQFRASVNSSGDLSKQSVARGYIIYNDNGELKVMYGDLDK